MKNGKIIKKNLKKTRLTIDNLFSILRVKDSFNLEQVDYLIAETTGDYSVAVKSDEQPVTKSLMGIPTTPSELSQLLIYEGKVDQKILEKNELNQQWIDQQLKLNNISKLEQVYVGILTPTQTLYINKQED